MREGVHVTRRGWSGFRVTFKAHDRRAWGIDAADAREVGLALQHWYGQPNHDGPADVAACPLCRLIERENRERETQERIDHER